jgi:RimJ/RimL family protein N-acetyltransferase
MDSSTPDSPADSLVLRDVVSGDLPIFFAQQLDPQANHMAAFTAKDPTDREAFDAHWRRILASSTVTIQTILYAGQVAGSVLSYEEDGRTEVSYWIGREFWGKGIATRALAAFLAQQGNRPLYARAAKDNIPSLRVLEKNGFGIVGEDKGFANARQAEVEEYLLRLD